MRCPEPVDGVVGAAESERTAEERRALDRPIGRPAHARGGLE